MYCLYVIYVCIYFCHFLVRGSIAFLGLTLTCRGFRPCLDRPGPRSCPASTSAASSQASRSAPDHLKLKGPNSILPWSCDFTEEKFMEM